MLIKKIQGAGGLVDAGGGGGDPYFDDVSLLLHCDGTDGSTTFTDSSSNNLSVSALGNAQIDTTVKKFGTGALELDGTGDYLTVAATAAMNVTGGNFTIESWIYKASSVDSMIISQDDGGSNGQVFQLRTQANNNLLFLYWANSSRSSLLVVSASAGVITLNTWTHVAVTFDGTDIRLFVDGNQENSASPASIYSNTLQTGIGNYNGTAGFTLYFNGYIDDVRITKGVARYTSSFTPPTAAFPDS